MHVLESQKGANNCKITMFAFSTGKYEDQLLVSFSVGSIFDPAGLKVRQAKLLVHLSSDQINCTSPN